MDNKMFGKRGRATAPTPLPRQQQPAADAMNLSDVPRMVFRKHPIACSIGGVVLLSLFVPVFSKQPPGPPPDFVTNEMRQQHPDFEAETWSRVRELNHTLATQLPQARNCDALSATALKPSSTTDNLQLAIECDNGRRFSFSTNGFTDVTPFDSARAVGLCHSAIKEKLRYPESFSAHYLGDGFIKTDKETGDFYYKLIFDAKNGFGNDIPQHGYCVITHKDGLETSISP